MSEQVRLRAAVVASSLAGVDDADLASLAPADRIAASRIRARVRSAGDRRRVAEAIVAERFALLRSPPSAPRSDLGATLYARWLRSLGSRERAQIARGLDASSLSAIGAQARSSVALVDPDRTRAAWMIAVGAKTLGRLPTAAELSGLLDALRDEGALDSRELVRWERCVRVAGRRDACEALARSLAEAR